MLTTRSGADGMPAVVDAGHRDPGAMPAIRSGANGMPAAGGAGHHPVGTGVGGPCYIFTPPSPRT